MTALPLALAYAALGIIEVYSKRSSLGYPYPVFTVTCTCVPFLLLPWRRHSDKLLKVHILLEQSSIRTISCEGVFKLLESYTFRQRSDSKGKPASKLVWSEATRPAMIVPQERGTPSEDTSPVQGQGKLWLVQQLWAIYYIAGTLVYSSIMAVTVVELFVWVMVSCATTAASKHLAFFLCIALEKRWERARSHRS